MQNSNYVNIKKISQETNAFFDAFAFGIKSVDLENLHQERTDIGEFLPGNIQQVLKTWVDKTLIQTPHGQAISIHDTAMLSVLTVLKKRGLSLFALRKIRDSLDLSMYNNCSVLDFVTLLCRNLALEQPDTDKTPYLVIDGENRITLALARDIVHIISTPEIATYSHIVLNMMSVFHECDIVLKINESSLGEFVDIPPQIATKLYDPIVKKITIDKSANRLHTIAENGENPQFGERLVKYQNGHVVSDVVKATEVLYE